MRLTAYTPDMRTILLAALCVAGYGQSDSTKLLRLGPSETTAAQVYAQPGWPQSEQFDDNNSPRPIQTVYGVLLPGPSQNVVNPIVAYKPDWNRWHWSALALASAAAIDLHSSRDLYELNPVLGRGPFGARQAAVKVSITAGLLASEYLVIRKWPSTERAWRWVNWIGAGATVGVATSNYTK